MQNITHAPEIKESFATDKIFDGCRDNQMRLTKRVKLMGNLYGTVTFKRCADGTHEASLRNSEGVVIAIANVDKFDV